MTKNEREEHDAWAAIINADPSLADRFYGERDVVDLTWAGWRARANHAAVTEGRLSGEIRGLRAALNRIAWPEHWEGEVIQPQELARKVLAIGSSAGLPSPFPAHEAGLYLSHNQHKDYYETVEGWEADLQGARESWVSEEQRAKAIAENSVWELQWYPHTPVGFCRLLACDLDVLLAAAKEAE